MNFQKIRKTNPKGLVHAFRQSLELFTMCVHWVNQARKDCFLIFWIEKKDDF